MMLLDFIALIAVAVLLATLMSAVFGGPDDTDVEDDE